MLCLTPVELSAVALLILTLSPMTACLTWFIQYTLKPGEIFGKYGLWLNFLWIKGRRRTIHRGKRKIRLRAKWYRHLLPPLGLCPYCNSVWVGSAFYALSAHALGMGLEALYAWPLFVGVQYVLVKLIGRLEND